MIQNPPLSKRLLAGDLSIPFYMALVKLLLHLFINLFAGYGIFRDELYYLACTEHLDIGYVDHPPFSIYVLKLVVLLIGDSVFAIRLVPALAGAATVYIVGVMTLSLGGNRYAQFLACLCSMTLITLAMNSYYSMNSIDILIWHVVGLLIIRIVQQAQPKHWILLGVILGVGLLNKIGILFLGAGLFVGLVATKQRYWLATKWPYLASSIATFLFLPYIFWNITYDYSHLEFIRNASGEKYASLTAFDFIKDQFLMNNPATTIVWMAGLIGLFFYSGLRQYRILTYLYTVPFLILVINGTSKAEYLAPAYGILFASGSTFLTSLTFNLKFKIVLRTILIAIIVLPLLLFLPMVVPVLPVEKYVAYADKLGFKPESSEAKELAELPPFYADMFGWREKALDVAKVYHSLTPEEQTKCAIFGPNYGRSAAIDYYRDEFDLPAAIGSHNNYFIWGPRQYDGELMIIIGGELSDYTPYFESVELMATSACDYCMPYEDNTSIFLCRKTRKPLNLLWPLIKHYD